MIRPYEQALSFVRQLGANRVDGGTDARTKTKTSTNAGTDLLKQLDITTGSSSMSGTATSSSSGSSRIDSGTDLVRLLGVDLLDVVLRDNQGSSKDTEGGGGGDSMVWMDPKTVNFAVYSSVPKDRRLDKVCGCD